MKNYKVSFILLLMAMILSSQNLSAGFIKLGGGANATNGGTGTLINFEGATNITENFALGISLETAVNGKGNNPLGGINYLIDIAKTSDFSNIDVSNAPGISNFTAGYVNLYYDINAPRGLYAFGGLGYGMHVQVKDSVAFLQEAMNMFEDYQNGDMSLDDLLNSQQFKDALNNLANNREDMEDLLGILNLGDLITYFDDPASINDLFNNKDEFNNVMDRIKNSLNENGTPQVQNVLCDVVFKCQQAVAYQAGIGYDLAIYKALGIDFYGKMQGLVVKEAPIFTVGANLILKW